MPQAFDFSMWIPCFSSLFCVPHSPRLLLDLCRSSSGSSAPKASSAWEFSAFQWVNFKARSRVAFLKLRDLNLSDLKLEVHTENFLAKNSLVEWPKSAARKNPRNALSNNLEHPHRSLLVRSLAYTPQNCQSVEPDSPANQMPLSRLELE